MRLLDLFAGAQGAGVGYARAGFTVTAVDIEPHDRHPGIESFYTGDALEILADTAYLSTFDVVHASPPCQAYTPLGARDGRHRELIGPVRDLLRAWGGVYIIENVDAARPHMINPVRMCGSGFGLHVRRHRWFESNVFLWGVECDHVGQGEIRAYYGKPGLIDWENKTMDNVQKAGRPPLYRGSVLLAPEDMGIDWMSWDDLRESIPPAYTTYLGEQLTSLLPVGDTNDHE